MTVNRAARREAATDIVYAKGITLRGLHRAVRRNVSLFNDEFWNVCGGEGSEGKDGRPLEGQHDSGQWTRLVGMGNTPAK